MGKATLLIMAAGLGSRYGGNKQVDGIGPHGEILMQYSIYDAVRAGFDKIVFVIKREHEELIRSFCKDIKGVELAFAYQDFSSVPRIYSVPRDRVKPFGTVHAVLCARECINEPFAIINADDFYGADAYNVIYAELQRLANNKGTMVSYKLKNTVSPSGGVTRGICTVERGLLRDVKETYNITVDSKGIIKDSEAGVLDENSKVSMNIWGFLPSIFDSMQKCFVEFLSGIKDGDIKAEYALPTMVDKLIKADSLEMSVLTTEAVWFGVTYKEDKPTVTSELSKLHNSGEYPERLF